MASRPVLVTDTNIWIDLGNGGIVAKVFRLPFRFVIPDFAIPELMLPEWSTLETLGLEAHELTADQVAEIARLRPRHPALSIVDLAALLLAKGLGAALLSGDRQLSALAAAGGLPVHGVLWLLDELLDSQFLTPNQAGAALRRMVDRGARLPAKGCRERLTRWGDQSGPG
jgi:hypothetical protein